MITDAQYDALVEEFAGDAGEDGPEEEDLDLRTVGSLWRLGQRCHSSQATVVGRRIATEARIEACVAAELVTGLRYEQIDTDWVEALRDLEQAQRDLRREHLLRRCGDRDEWKQVQELDRDRWEAALEEADAVLVERIDYAIRRWERAVAETDLEDLDPEETTMAATKTKRAKTTIKAWYDAAGELRWQCPDCRTEHSEVKKVCGCGRVRPITAHLIEIARAAEAADVPATQAEAAAKEAAVDGPAPAERASDRNGFTRWRSQLGAQCDLGHLSGPLTDHLRQLYVAGVTPDAAAAQLRDQFDRNWPASAAGGADLSAVGALTHGPERRAAETADTSWSTLDAVLETELPVALIDLRSDNPRQAVDAAALQQLAATIADHGLENRIVVREAPGGRYELWQGERRLRAVREVLQRETIPAKVYPAATPEREMVRGRAWENLAREDLDPIEAAASLEQMLAAGAYASQTALGTALGISQGEVANRLGLLKLPEEWRRRVMSREMSAAHARALVPWVDRPAVLTAVAELIEGRRWWNGDPYGSQQEFRDLVARCVRDCSRPLSGAYWANGSQGRILLTPKQLRDPRLDVAPVPTGGKKSERRAFNVELWDCWQAEGLARQATRRDSAAAAARTPAEAATPAQTRARAHEQAEQLANKVARYLRRWQQARMAPRVADCGLELVLKLLLYFTATERMSRDDEIAAQVKAAGGRKITSSRYGGDVWATLSTLVNAGDFEWAARALVAEWLQVDTENCRCGLRKDDVAAIATELGVDLAREWRVDEEFLKLHTKDQLKSLAREWRIGHLLIHAGEKRSDQIAEILRADAAMKSKHLPPPKVLVKAGQ